MSFPPPVGKVAAQSLDSEDLEATGVKTSLASSLFALTKPRLSLLTVITAVVTYAAARPAWDLVVFLGLLFGTSLSAGGALTLNQWLERDKDRIMERTRDRPLPRQAITPGIAFSWGFIQALLGVSILMLFVNGLSAFLATATIVIYVAVYTPLKRWTIWATQVGAIPGAIPPLIGWVAAQGEIAGLGWIVFGILFFWQMPHFYAVGWIYREDYRSAGFRILPALDKTGRATANCSLAYSFGLLGVSLIPWLINETGAIYGVSALVAGVLFVWQAIRFAVASENRARDMAARRLFFGSLIYLPLVLSGLVIDRWS